MSDLPIDVQMSLSPADTYLASLVKNFMIAQEEVNKRNISIFNHIQERMNAQREMIDNLSILVELQKQMIDLLSAQILK